MTSSIAGKHIVIAGAGLSGLAFAHTIEKFWPEEYEKPTITIYERGPKQVDADREGYSLSIRSEKTTQGLQVLQKLGILDHFLQYGLPGIHGGKASLQFRDAAWKSFASVKPKDPPPDGLPLAQMRVMRPILRQHLIDTLPASVEVHWSTMCTSARHSKDGEMQVVLDDGTTADCDLLIAGDGANSKIRNAILPAENPSFAGVVCILGRSTFLEGVPPEIYGSWGPIVGGQGNGLFVFDIDNKNAAWQVSYLADRPRDNIRREDIAGQEKDLLDEVKRRGQVFSQPFGKLIDATDLKTLTIVNARDKEPIKHAQLDGMPVIFIGDSNHPVTPFSGSGANMALMDGMELAHSLCDPSQTFETIVSTFDDKCAARSKEALSGSRMTIKILHSKGWMLFIYTTAIRIVFLFFKVFGSA